jgi:ATP-dependent Clp protease ATP-binding subunit ClpA
MFLNSSKIEGGVNLTFTLKAQEALLSAQNLAEERGQRVIDIWHLLYVLLSQEESIVSNLIRKRKINYENLKKKINKMIERTPEILYPKTPPDQIYLTQNLSKVLDQAKEEALKLKESFISTGHLLLAILKVDTEAKKVLKKENLSYENFLEELSKFEKREETGLINGILINKQEYIKEGNTRWILEIKLENGETITLLGKAEILPLEEIKKIIALKAGEFMTCQKDEDNVIIHVFKKDQK